MISGSARLYAVIGDPLHQSFAIPAFNARFQARAKDAVMVPFQVGATGLAALVAALRGLKSLGGVLVTMPHKVAIVPLIDALGPAARLAGAVNAVRREAGGRLVGDMFDGRGLVASLTARGHRITGARVLLVGAGGAGRAIAFALAEAGAAALRIADLEEARATALAAAVRAAFPACAAGTGAPDPEGAAIVVNASPAGMAAKDALPVAVAAIAPDAVVVDAVLEPETTRLIAAAEARGHPVHRGRDMLGARWSCSPTSSAVTNSGAHPSPFPAARGSASMPRSLPTWGPP